MIQNIINSEINKVSGGDKICACYNREEQCGDKRMSENDLNDQCQSYCCDVLHAYRWQFEKPGGIVLSYGYC